MERASHFTFLVHRTREMGEILELKKLNSVSVTSIGTVLQSESSW